MLKLNLGCGKNKIAGAINIDIEESCKPDLVHNFVIHPLPYEDGSVDVIYFFHTIEHIPKKYHHTLFRELARVLKVDGTIYISYPEFVVIAQNFIDNKHGVRASWENMIYGRQLYETDYHLALMHTPTFIEFLKEFGFTKIAAAPENEMEYYNTAVRAVKGALKVQSIEESYVENWKLNNEKTIDVSTIELPVVA